MEPVSPVLTEALVPNEIVFAKNQPQYRQLPAIRSDSGVVLSRWTLTQAEREAVARGADVFLRVRTMGEPLQPVTLEIAETPSDIQLLAGVFGFVAANAVPPMPFDTTLPEGTQFAPMCIQVPDVTFSQEKAEAEKESQCQESQK